MQAGRHTRIAGRTIDNAALIEYPFSKYADVEMGIMPKERQREEQVGPNVL